MKPTKKFMLRFILAAFLLLAAGPVGSLTAKAAEDGDVEVKPWHKVYLKPGSTYNVGSAHANTSVYINQPGNYTLKGHSKKVRVVIKSVDVKVYLADGLKIEPGTTAYVGSQTSAISIDDMKGTVRLISKENAHIRLTSYLKAPAISKDGLKTKLIFETENPNKPGTIVADSATFSGSAGIGSNFSLTAGHITGNMVFESGNVEAYGAAYGAGIGGSNGGDCKNITINGGKIYAEGMNAAGIGGGLKGWAKNITINGGEVTAKGDRGSAGIGGYGDGTDGGKDGSNITINGGIVNAYSEGLGSAIGGGTASEGRNITINGGIVKAHTSSIHGSGAAIGGGSNVGNAHAGAGINIRINGGTVYTYTGKYGTGIGGNKYGDKKSDITIAGGTIIAQGGNKEGAADISGKKGSRICIIGGSVKAEKINGTPVNQAGQEVYKTKIMINDVPHKTKITKASILGTDPAYGLEGVHVGEDPSPPGLYFWLPKNPKGDGLSTATLQLNGQEVVYSAVDDQFKKGVIKAGERGILYQPTAVTLKAGDGGGADGSAHGVLGETALDNFKPVTPPEGHHVKNYVLDKVPVLVADEKGKLYANAKIDNLDYTDNYRAWLPVMESTTFNAEYQVNTYKVAFDRNKPKNASNDVAGSMDNQSFEWDEKKALTPSAYSLKGWTFKGWNTKADGSGTAYSNGAEVEKLTEEDGGTVTLYAQWAPKNYTITFQSGEGTGADQTTTAAYDEPRALPLAAEMGFNRNGFSFMGWSHGAVGHLYGDGATVCNLCSVSADGSLTGGKLTAQWHHTGTVKVLVCKNRVPTNVEDLGIEGDWNGIALKTKGGSSYYEIPKEGIDPGDYEAASISAGIYDVYLMYEPGSPGGTTAYQETGRTVTVDNAGTGVLLLDYSTVKAKVEGGHGSAWISEEGTAEAVLMTGSKAAIGSIITTKGRKFAEYTAAHSQPFWGDGGRGAQEQAITVTGEMTITAHTLPILYQVTFDANAPDVTGTMEAQDFVYGQPQSLFACGFQRPGYTFREWTRTMLDEKPYFQDQAQVQNLSDQDGEQVTMYAQWTPQPYFIKYNSNGAHAGIQIDRQKTFYDNPTRLMSLSSLGFALEDYHFTGWNTKPGGTGTAYEDGQEVRNLTTEAGAEVMLWAQWEHDFYTVRYDANGGQGTMEPDELFINVRSNLSDNYFVKSDHDFTGWNTSPNGTGTAYKDGQEVLNLVPSGETVTLYAQWEKHPDGGGPGAKTGDSHSLIIWLIIMAIAAIAGAVTFLVERRS